MKNSAVPRHKGRCGFTLIELLIVMLILAILAGVVVMSVGGIFEDTKERAYEELRGQIQNAVIAYELDRPNELPPEIGMVNISGNNKRIFDICSLTLPTGLLRTAPDGCILINGSSNDNCDSTIGNCSGCLATSHYIWAYDLEGNIYSTCVGSDCKANNADGYQGIWP